MSRRSVVCLRSVIPRWHRSGLLSASAARSERAASGLLDGSPASALHGAPYGPLHAGQRAGERGLKRCGPMLDHHAWKAAQDHLDAAQQVDSAARTVYVAHPNRDALDRILVLPELFTESTPDVCPVILIEPHPVDSDVRWSQRPGRPARGPLHRSGHAIGEWCPLLIARCPKALCRRSHVVVGIGLRSSHGYAPFGAGIANEGIRLDGPPFSSRVVRQAWRRRLLPRRGDGVDQAPRCLDRVAAGE